MKNLSKMAGATMLAALLAACGGGGGGADAADEAVAVQQAAQQPVQQPVQQPMEQAATPVADASVGAESITTEVAESVATDPWVQTWDDAELDAYYPSRPIRVAVTGQGSVGNEVRGTAGTMNCVQGGTSCNAIYAKYTTILLSAVPKAGQVFLGWSGACSGSGTRSTCEIRNYMLHNVGATFGPA